MEPTSDRKGKKKKKTPLSPLPQGECSVYGGLRTYPSPSRPRQSHPQPSVELEVPERRLRSAKVVNSIGSRRPLCAPVRVRSGVSAPTEPEYKEERERKGRVSALPVSGTAVMVMIGRGGAECGFRAAEKCGLKGAGWCTSVHVHGERVEPRTVK